MNRQPSIFKTLIVAIIFFFAGLLSYQHLTKPIAEEAEVSKEWPIVDGIITHSTLAKSRDHDGKEMYSANIQYDYVVGGEKYSSSVISIGDGSSSMQSSVKKTLKKYAEGRTVVVHYDPEFPDSAVLETGTGFLFGLLLKMPLLLCIISVLMVLNLFKRLLFRR